MKNTSKALAALTQAALALPGVALAAEVQSDYLFSYYKEGDISGSKSAGNASERYEILSHMFRVVAPLGDSAVGLNLTYETMSGASPWWIQPGTNGAPQVVMSGASIREERVDLQGTYSLPVAPFQTAFTLGYSTEDDYEAINAGVELELEDDENGVTWTGGLGYSSDTIKPVQLTGFDRIDEDDKSTLTLYGGAALVLNANTVVQGSLSYQKGDGYLTDPYKRIWLTSTANTAQESRPDGRQSWAASAKLRHFLTQQNAAVHVDYRYYHDDWEIDAHTLEVAWAQSLPDNLRIIPSLRWYSQSQAFFYAPYYNAPRGDGFGSSDYRLSPYGALSARVDVSKAVGALAFGGGLEYYKASKDFALKSVDVENPALIDYWSVQLRATYRF
ncbi:DUF3570 domain-containing protein [Solimonas sp. K1W22B-7]|uniref:DUF3570 domain-containing protein n=1 Tax=Solimonas sp. K1W22B-7 TaxID=2303331 RepID=UPI000E337565|nr:DUF3570 domain-containing protein [Solimonas sp. K1W22B-7]AXQ31519.1 DUF3570 domain-containing protein [Solimonas sp. K1W22B-7]